MKLSKKVVIPALIALALPAGFALAQGGSAENAPGQDVGPGMGRGWFSGWGHGRRASPETLERLNEGRIAMAKTALKLTDAQQKLWDPLEQQMRQGFAERTKRREEMRKLFQERRAAADKARQDKQQPPAPPSMADRLDRMSQMASERADRLKAFNTAFKPFYASLSDEQKAVAEIVLKEMRGGGREGRGHHRWAMGDRMGDGMGPGWFRGRGPGADAAPPAPPAPPAKQ